MDEYAIMFLIAGALATVNFIIQITGKTQSKILNFLAFCFTVWGCVLVNRDLRNSATTATDTNTKVTRTDTNVVADKAINEASQRILRSVQDLENINHKLSKNINTVVNKTEAVSSLISKTVDTLNKFANGGDSYPYFYIDGQPTYLNRYVETIGRYPLSGIVLEVYDLNLSKYSAYNPTVEDTINQHKFEVPVLTVPHLLDRFPYDGNSHKRTFAFQIYIQTQKARYVEYFALRRRYKVFAIFSRISRVESPQKYKEFISNGFLNKGETNESFLEHITDSSYLNRPVHLEDMQ